MFFLLQNLNMLPEWIVRICVESAITTARIRTSAFSIQARAITGGFAGIRFSQHISRATFTLIGSNAFAVRATTLHYTNIMELHKKRQPNKNKSTIPNAYRPTSPVLPWVSLVTSRRTVSAANRFTYLIGVCAKSVSSSAHTSPRRRTHSVYASRSTLGNTELPGVGVQFEALIADAGSIGGTSTVIATCAGKLTWMCNYLNYLLNWDKIIN